jgi:hypothetical protein
MPRSQRRPVSVRLELKPMTRSSRQQRSRRQLLLDRQIDRLLALVLLNYCQTVLRIRDGLLKLKDFPPGKAMPEWLSSPALNLE